MFPLMVKELCTAALAAGIAAGASAKDVVIDLRTPPEIASTGAVKGALAADYRSPDFESQLAALHLEKTDNILLYCRSGVRAGEVKTLLEKRGFLHVTNLGGYEDASDALKLPLIRP